VKLREERRTKKPALLKIGFDQAVDDLDLLFGRDERRLHLKSVVRPHVTNNDRRISVHFVVSGRSIPIV
jgi:hypothetical protein